MIAAKSDPRNVLRMVKVKNSESFRVIMTGEWFGDNWNRGDDCNDGERHIKTHRLCGPKNQRNDEKNSAPRAKQTVAARDLAQEYQALSQVVC